MEHNARAGQIDVVRGIAMIGVIFIHSSFQNKFDPFTLSISSFLSTLFDWAVLAFFFLSGLLLNEQRSLVSFLKKRFQSLLIPFFFYNLLYNFAFAAVVFLTGKHLPRYQWELSQFWLSLFHSPAFQLYFLLDSFVISIGVFCLCKMIEARWHSWLLVAGVIFMVAFYQWAGWPEQSHGPEWVKLPLYLTAFLMGVAGQTVTCKKHTPLSGVFLLICVILSLVSRQSCLLALLVPPTLYRVVSAVQFLRDSKLLQQIGRSSGAIYLWHTPLLLPAFTAILAFLHIPPIVNLGVSVVLTISVCIIVREICKRSFEKYLKMKMPRSIIP